MFCFDFLINVIIQISLNRYSARVNFSQPLRNLSSSYTASTRSSHYSIIGALVGTLTGLGLVINKQKVRLFSHLLSVIITNCI